MIKFVLRIDTATYLKCSKRNTFAPIGLYGATLYGSRQGAISARKAAYRTYPEIDIVIVNLEFEVTEK